MNPRQEFERRVERLKSSLRTATDLSRLHAQFHEELGLLPMLHDCSEPRRDPELERVLAAGLARLDPTQTYCIGITLFAPSVGLWHGQVAGDGLLGTFFGFEATSQLCLGILDAKGQSHFLRLTTHRVKEDVTRGPSYPMRTRGVA